ncbi:MAG: tyrosine-type recombinase/integrase, partial [Pseudolabrys sp.]
HMLRHSCGYKLANDGQDTRAIQHYLGHRSITPTVFIYRSLASAMDLEEFGAGSGFLSRPACIVPPAAT